MKETDNYIFFWKEYLSQWHKRDIIDHDGVKYNCCEQYMMAEKARVFQDTNTLNDILSANTPDEQKKLGRKVRNFDGNIWNSVCLYVVYNGNLLKFTQHPDLKDKLLATGNKTLVEASPADQIWGIGMAEDHPDIEDWTKWKGKNLLGIALMRVRSTIAMMK